MFRKKGAKRGFFIGLAFLTLILLVHLTALVVAQEPQVTLDLSLDKKTVQLDDSVKFTLRTYINDILVLSVPMRLIVTDPSGEESGVTLIGHTNGDYIGSYLPKTPGDHNVTATVTIDTEETRFEESFTVLTDSVDLVIDIPDRVYYRYGPLEINGSIALMDEGLAISNNVELYLASTSSPFYQALCTVPCTGQCNFSCLLSRNIELGEYYIMARIKHKNHHYTSKDTFAVEIPQTENLTLNLTVPEVAFPNDSLVIDIEAMYYDEPLRDAMVNVFIVGPDSRDNFLATELVPGLYSYTLKPNIIGNYSVQITLAKGGIFGRAGANFSLVPRPTIFSVENYSIAVDTATGEQFLISHLKLSNVTECHISVDELSLKDQINYSTISLLIDNRRIPLQIKPEGIRIGQEILAGIKNDDAIFEAHLLDRSMQRMSTDWVMEYNTMSVSLDMSLELVRISARIPETSQVKYVVDADLNLIDAWVHMNGTLYFYGMGERFTVYIKHLRNITLYNRDFVHTYKNISGTVLPYAEHVTDSMRSPGTRDITVYSHNFVEITSLSLDRDIIVQNDNVALHAEVLSLDPFTSNIRVFYPNGSLMLEDLMVKDYSYKLANDTPPGIYTVIVDCTDKKNITDTSILKFPVFSGLPSVTLDRGQSKRAVRNSNIFYRHIVTNNNYRNSDVIGFVVKSNFSQVLLYHTDGVTLLEDTNRNGLRDTGVLPPGGSMEFLVKVVIPPNTPIGVVDEMQIIAQSQANTKVTAMVIDRTEIIPFEEREEALKNDIELVSLEQVDRNLVIGVRNLDSDSHIIKILFTEKGGGETVKEILDLLISGRETRNVIYALKLGTQNYQAEARILDVYEEPYSDEDNSNNWRSLAVNQDWYDTSLNYRIPFPYRETLHINHEDFNVRLYASFSPGIDKDSIRVVYHDGSKYIPGKQHFTTYESGGGFMVLQLHSIAANSEGLGYIYYSTNTSREPAANGFTVDLIMNNDRVKAIGRWVGDNQVEGYYGSDYLHDLNLEKGRKSIEYHPALELDNYEIYARYPAYPSFADNVPVLVHSALGTEYVELNQQLDGGSWNYIGAYTMDKDSYISLENFGTSGIVVADAFMFRRISFYSSPLETERLVNGSIIGMEERIWQPKGAYELDEINISMTLLVNSSLELDLLEYFNYLTYISYNATNRTSVEFNESLVTIIPASGFIGKTTVSFDNNFGRLTLLIAVLDNATMGRNITLDENITSVQNVTINETAVDINETVETITADNETNKSLVLSEKQLHARVGEPVKWKKEVVVRDNRTIELPKEASSIMVYDHVMAAVPDEQLIVESGDNRLNLTDYKKIGEIRKLKMLEAEATEKRKKTSVFSGFGMDKVKAVLEENRIADNISKLVKTLPENVGEMNLTDNLTLAVPELGSYIIEYQTEAPQKTEQTLNESGIFKQIKVYSNATVHYHNVTATTEIPEMRQRLRLYHLIDGKRVDVTDRKEYGVLHVDIDSNGLYDMIQWIVPELSEQYFEVGLASINTRKSIYHPDETAEIVVVVLDNEGYLVEDASVLVNITTPNNMTYTFSTAGEVVETDKGIYELDFSDTSLEGVYDLHVEAIGDNVHNSMVSYFEVREYYEFDILRSTPVTIDPWKGPFESTIQIISYTDAAEFNFSEVVPKNITITDSGGADLKEVKESIIVTWQNLENNSVVSYKAQAPLVTPDLYTLGPSFVQYGPRIFYEARPWFLAIDPFVQEFFDDFNSGAQPNASKWTETPVGGLWNIVGQRGHAENCDAPGDQITSIVINLSAYEAANVSFDWETSSLDNGAECLNLDVNNGSGWVNDVFSECGSTASGSENIDMTQYGLTSTFQIRYDCQCSSTFDDVYIDNVDVTGYYNLDPNVTLNTPAAGYWNDTSNPKLVVFNCSITDDEDAVNISLWMTDKDNSSFAYNDSCTIPGVNGSCEWTKYLHNGNYTWNCLGYDQKGEYDWGDSNRTILINSTAPVVNKIQCRESGSWQDCSNMDWGETITAVRANCTVISGSIANVTFNLTNIPDANEFFRSNSSYSSSDWWVYNNTDLTINDSGEFKLEAFCFKADLSNGTGSDNWTVPWGTLWSKLINPTSDTNVYQNNTFPFTSQVNCTGGECGYINATLYTHSNGYWWDSAFERRKEINLTNPGSTTLTNFPAYLNIAHDSDMQMDFDDLRFVNGSCGAKYVEELYYEKEAYTASTNTHIWLNVTLGTGVTSICMYYGNSDVSDGENPTNVWDSDFNAVWHLHDNVLDSTSNGNNGVDDGSSDQIGKIADGRYLDGASDHIVVPLAVTNGLQIFTFCYWINTSENSASGTFWQRPTMLGHETGGGGSNDLGITSNTGDIGMWSGLNGGADNNFLSGTSINDNLWHYICVINDDSTADMYVDMVYIDQLDTGDPLGATAFWVGGRAASTEDHLGVYDELRMSKTDRSVDWINQTYQMVANHASFVSYGAEEKQKEIITMVVGDTPFYSLTSNPMDSATTACLADMRPGKSCNTTWTLNATGEINSTWQLSAAYGSMNFTEVTDNETPKVNITIIMPPLPVVNEIQCRESGSWQDCSNIGWAETITAVRVNCTHENGTVVNASFNLTNIPDSNTFFYSNSDYSTSDWWVYNNTDLVINDSGGFKLIVVCVDSIAKTGSGYDNWTVPWGNLTSMLINPATDRNVYQNYTFSFTSQVNCTGGECGFVNATLDPPFSGSFYLFWDGGAAPTGWTCVSCNPGEEFYNLYPVGNSTFGDTGGGTTHTHTIAYDSETGGATVNMATSGNNRATAAHIHGSISGTSVTSASNIPLTRSLKIIKYDNGIPAKIPTGAIAIFNSSSLPDNWTRYANQDGYFIIGNDSVSVSGSNTHTHDVSYTLDASGNMAQTDGWPNNQGVAVTTHTHSVSGDTGPAGDNRPPYLHVILAKADNEVLIPDGQDSPNGMIAMFNMTPPGNWDVVSGSGDDFYERFLVGNDTYGGTGGDKTHANPDHTSPTGASTGDTTDNGGGTAFADNGHTHTVTVTYSNNSHMPPYKSVIFAYANEIVAKGTIPMNSGTPFYSLTANPMDFTTTGCLADMKAGRSCNTTWVVNATGEINSTWEFFALYESTNYTGVLDNTTPSVNLTIRRPPIPDVNEIQCRESGSWQDCSNIGWAETITAVRVNCTHENGTVVNASFVLTNIPDSNTFFSSNSDYSTSDWWVYNNTDLTINDSGEFKLSVVCIDSLSKTGSGYANWTVPWGNLSSSLISPDSDNNVTQNYFFTFTSNVSCVGGECGYVNATLDPYIGDWWNKSWHYRKEINITNIGTSTLSDYPAYLNISYDSDMLLNYSDLRFMNESCGTNGALLDYELVNYTSTKADVWVRIPSLSTGDTSICMYYGNSGAGTGENPTGVWDSNYLGVYHLEDNAGAAADGHKDSTANTYDGTGEGASQPTQTTGIVGIGQDFDSGERIDLGADVRWDSAFSYTGSFTITVWLNMDDLTVDRCIVCQTDVSDGDSEGLIWWLDTDDGGDGYVSYYYDAASQYVGDRTVTNAVTGSWQMVWVRFDGANGHIGFDDEIIEADHALNTWTDSSERMSIGSGHGDNAVRPLIAQVDEVRISNISRSNDWINQSYQMVVYQDSLVSYGAEEDTSKGIIPMNSGTPFYTTTSNPMNSTTTACLADMRPGTSCYTTWSVNATGAINSTWEFFITYAAVNYSTIPDNETSRVNLTIIGPPQNPEMREIQCQEQGVGWQACSNMDFDETLLAVRVNCTDPLNGSSITPSYITNASFDLTNKPDSNSLFSGYVSYWDTDWLIYNNTDLVINDSGEMNLSVVCTSSYSLTVSNHSNWTVPWGALRSNLVTPSAPTNVTRYQFFNFTANVTCLSRECGWINASVHTNATPALIPSSGTPFYTTTPNPMNSTTTACLADMKYGDSCEMSWSINASGDHNTTWEFFASFNSFNYTKVLKNETSRVDITILNITILKKKSNLSIYDQTDSPINSIARIYQQVYFYANYTNTTGSPASVASWCNISFNLSSGWTAYVPMSYNSTSGLYEYNRSFTQVGDIAWNVSCDSESYWPKLAVDTVLINRTTADATAPASGTSVDRDSVSAVSDTITLEASISGAPSGVNITFYMDLTDPSIGGQTELYIGWNTTDSSGTAEYTYNLPSTRYAGNYTWYANATSNGQHVADANVTRYIYIYGGLDVVFNQTTVNPNATYLTGDTIIVDANVYSLGPETESELNSSYSAEVNSTLSPPTVADIGLTNDYNGSFWRNSTYSFPHTSEAGIWNAYLNSSAEYFYFDDNVGLRNFTLNKSTQLDIWDQVDDGIVARVFDLTNFTANFTDLADNPVATGNCTIMFNDSGTVYNMWYDAGDNLYHYEKAFTKVGNFTWNVSCNGSYYESQFAEDTVLINSTFVDAVDPADGTGIDRDSVQASVPDLQYLIAKIPYAFPNVNITYYGDLTDPVFGGQTGLYLGWNTTNASGYATLGWNPGSSYYAGNYTWYANATNASMVLGETNNTRTVYVYGGLNVTFNQSTVNPNATYLQNQTVEVQARLQSLGPESETQLNSSYHALVNSTFFKTNGLNDTIVLSYNVTYWNNTYLISYTAPVGIWNVSLNSTAEWFYGNDTYRAMTVIGHDFLDVWDNNGTTGENLYFPCDTLIEFYANYTDTSDNPIPGATCNISFYDSYALMAYNATLGLYLFNRTFDYQGSYSYTVECDRQFYENDTDTGQYIVKPLQNLTIAKYITSIQDDNYYSNITIINNRNCPLKDIRAYDLIPTDFTSYGYSLNITYSQPVSGVYSGNATYWLFNLSSSEEMSISYYLNGSSDYALLDAYMVGIDPFIEANLR